MPGLRPVIGGPSDRAIVALWPQRAGTLDIVALRGAVAALIVRRSGLRNLAP